MSKGVKNVKKRDWANRAWRLPQPTQNFVRIVFIISWPEKEL